MAIWRRKSVILLVSFGISYTVPASAVTLVRNGDPSSAIVLADKPSESAQLAASELKSWLRKISGATIPIQPESSVNPDTKQALILIGDTKQSAQLGLQSSTFELEECRIQTLPNRLVLIGDDEREDGLRLYGTLWAVETFVEKYLQVRYLWPGPLGQVVPHQATIEVSGIDYRFVPALRQRRIRNLGYSDRMQRGLDKLGWSAEEFRRLHSQAKGWFFFHRIGGSFRGNYGHAYGDYWKRFHREHLDWFALQPDGTRDNSRAEDGRRARLCVSNAGLIEQIAHDCIAKIRKNPQLDTVSISPNDGSRGATFCQCPACEAWDAPEGKMIEIWNPKGGSIPHVSLTDRHVRFYSAVAEIVAEEYPNRLLGAYAYSTYKLPPVHVKLHPNVMIGFVPGTYTYLNEDARDQMRESWLAWSQSSKHLFLRPNFLRAGFGCPTLYAHRLAEDIRFFADQAMLVTDFDCCEQHWATDGLTYYVLAKLLWNPKGDVDAIIADYCRTGFGPAAKPIRDYFALLEQMTTRVADARQYEGRSRNHEYLAGHYTDKFLEQSRALLDEGRRLAESDEQVCQRIDFLSKAIEYARIRRDWAQARAALRQRELDARTRLKTAEAQRDQWYQQLGLSWALNVPRLQFYGY